MISSVSEPSVQCVIRISSHKPWNILHLIIFSWKLLQSPLSPLPESTFAQATTQPLSLPTEKWIYTHQHSCSCNLVPFLEPLAALRASSSLCESIQPFISSPPGRWRVCHPGGHPAWMGIHASWTSNTHTCPQQAAQPSSGALNCRELFLWSWSCTAGTCYRSATEGQRHRWQWPISTTSFVLQALNCSQSFTAVPTGNIWAASHRCDREDPSTEECFFQ